MAHDFAADIDRLGKQLYDLRALFARQAGNSAEDAAAYLAPRARQVASQFQKEAPRFLEAVGRNPSAATGALLGALAIGTVLGLFLASGARNEGQ